MMTDRLNPQRVCPNRGFALVVTLVLVALLAIITVGLLTSVSVERTTATSYTNRYQAELAAQNGLQAAAKTLAASPTGTGSITGTDTFLIVRPDAPADANGNKAAYYYLAQPAPNPGNSITYYPLFSSSTNPNTPDIQTPNIVRDASDPRAAHAPFVPPPVPPPDSSGPNDGSGTAWNAAGTQRQPALYPWVQPSPSPSGPSVKWVEMRDPQDTPTAPAHNLPYPPYPYLTQH